MIKIDQKIVGHKVVTQETKVEEVSAKEVMHEKVERPHKLIGATYKLKPGGYDHALYVTINDYVLNEGTEHEQLIPYEIFLNSKAMESYQWIVALTRVISAVFRKGGDATFLIEELGSVFDPKGGYWSKGRYVPSVVADIANVLKEHLIHIGLHIEDAVNEHVVSIIQQKRKEFEAVHGETDPAGYPPQATLCSKCNTKAVIIMDGCSTCLSCLDSRCG